MNFQSSVFSVQQKRNTLITLSFFHIFIIAASNYLVQIPFSLQVPLTEFSFHSTWGTLTFPFIFLATDLTVRIFGASAARKIIFVVMIPALIISYLISVLFFESRFQGWSALGGFNGFVFRIAFASFCAYAFGQLLDVSVFNRLRKLKIWWIAPSSSMLFGSMADTFLFFAIAFYAGSDPFMAQHWVELGFVDYLFKLFIGIVLFVPAYGVALNMLIRKVKSLTITPQLA